MTNERVAASSQKFIPASDIRMPKVVRDALNSTGKPLDVSTRAYMEPRFGYDFSQVRIHDDAQAAESASALNAQAYTVGRDVVFGAGRYVPGRTEGKQLLAHELTHVMQQGSMAFQAGSMLRVGSPNDSLEQQAEAAAHPGIGMLSSNFVQRASLGAGPLLQRRLLVTGASKDIRDFIGVLEPASGFTLKHDPKTNEITITASKLKPQSFVLASRLATIASDPDRDAEIHLGRKKPGVLFGAFPMSEGDMVQEIRIDQILALEKGVPGAGAATLAHELVENYEAHALKDHRRSTIFGTVHEAAQEVEDLIAGELIGKGESRSVFAAEVKSGRRKTTLWVDDRTQYFIVWEEGKNGQVVNARKVSRASISKHTISGFSKKSGLPTGAASVIKSVADEMKKNPTASVLIEGFASVGKTADENVKLGEAWAEETRDQIASQVKDLMLGNWRRFHMIGNSAKGRNEVRISLERPDI